MIVGSIRRRGSPSTAAAQAAYLASGLQNQAGMPATLSVLGGPMSANDRWAVAGLADEGKAMWMPRVSARTDSATAPCSRAATASTTTR